MRHQVLTRSTSPPTYTVFEAPYAFKTYAEAQALADLLNGELFQKNTYRDRLDRMVGAMIASGKYASEFPDQYARWGGDFLAAIDAEVERKQQEAGA